MAVKNKIFLPTLISSVDYQPVRTLPHIYFYNGLKECDEYFIQHYPSGSTSAVTASVQQKFPYFDYYDGLVPTTGSNSLLFFNETPPYGVTPTGSLYTEYWDKYVNLLYNPRTRLINASAIIPLADYFEMELNDIVQWRGNYYHLRAINDYNLKDGTCKLQLLGPIISDAATITQYDCTFNFSSSFAGDIVLPTTTTTLSPTTTTTLSPTTTTTTLTPTTTAAPTTTTTTVAALNVNYLMVAGGGGGGSRHAGGGGAGGFISGSATLAGATSFAVVVGAGGIGTTGVNNGGPGNRTTFNSLTAHGGGFGGGGSTFTNGGVGGSGGGALGVNGAIGGTSSGSFQGNSGGAGVSYAGGGGGGAVGTGTNGTVTGGGTTSNGGAGGQGKFWLDGNRYAGGGGGAPMGSPAYTNWNVGVGGPGGGGDSGNPSTSLNGNAGATNSGGGGGAAAGSGPSAGNGAQGGSGIVIIRYSGTPRATGGTITQSGGFTYHTFTSSGTFTT